MKTYQLIGELGIYSFTPEDTRGGWIEAQGIKVNGIDYNLASKVRDDGWLTSTWGIRRPDGGTSTSKAQRKIADDVKNVVVRWYANNPQIIETLDQTAFLEQIAGRTDAVTTQIDELRKRLSALADVTSVVQNHTPASQEDIEACYDAGVLFAKNTPKAYNYRRKETAALARRLLNGTGISYYDSYVLFTSIAQKVYDREYAYIRGVSDTWGDD